MSHTIPSKASQDLLSVSFNQDGSCLSVGTRRGYSIANVEPFGKVYTKSDGPCSIVEMLFCTSLVAVVGTADSQPSSSPRKLKIINTKVGNITPCPQKADSYHDTETVHNMRACVPHCCPWCQVESKAPGCHFRRRNLHLRHLKYEASSHNRDEPQSPR